MKKYVIFFLFLLTSLGNAKAEEQNPQIKLFFPKTDFFKLFHDLPRLPSESTVFFYPDKTHSFEDVLKKCVKMRGEKCDLYIASVYCMEKHNTAEHPCPVFPEFKQQERRCQFYCKECFDGCLSCNASSGQCNVCPSASPRAECAVTYALNNDNYDCQTEGANFLNLDGKLLNFRPNYAKTPERFYAARKRTSFNGLVCASYPRFSNYPSELDFYFGGNSYSFNRPHPFHGLNSYGSPRSLNGECLPNVPNKDIPVTASKELFFTRIDDRFFSNHLYTPFSYKDPEHGFYLKNLRNQKMSFKKDLQDPSSETFKQFAASKNVVGISLPTGDEQACMQLCGTEYHFDLISAEQKTKDYRICSFYPSPRRGYESSAKWYIYQVVHDAFHNRNYICRMQYTP